MVGMMSMEQLCHVVDPQGAFAVYAPRDGLLVTRARGWLSTQMADAWIAAVDPLFVAGVRVHSLHDWESMTGYDDAARRVLTKWVVQRRTFVRSARFVATSSVVTFGISLAALAASLAGVELRVCGRREFDEALASHLSPEGALRGLAPAAVGA